MRILLGSPLPDHARWLAGLVGKGRRADVAEPFAELPAVAQHHGPYDVVVISVPDCRSQAVQTLRGIRRRGLRLPALVLATRCDAQAEREAREAGADEVLAAPVGVPVLLERLKALHRRALGHGSARLACGNVALDQERRCVTAGHRPVRLTPREFSVLEMLMLRPGEPLAKECFLTRAYAEGEGPGPRILDVFVCKLRGKLAAAGGDAVIRTVWGRGYVIEPPTEPALPAAS